MDKINKIVSSLFGAFNVIIALVLLFITLLASFNMPSFELGLLVLAVGFVLTMIGCGITAVLREIKSDVTEIKKKLEG